MNKLILILTTFLTACGGGSSSTTSHSLDGKWTTGCHYSASDNLAEHNIFTISGGSFTRDASIYNTSDCSGSASEKIVITGKIDYVGEQLTSVCTAEKINVSYNKIIVNGTALNSQQFNLFFLRISNLSNPTYDIACVFSNKMWVGDHVNGLDGTTANRRPTTIDLSLPAIRI